MTIQLTNPNILDLTEWQKVINEINNISAKIDAITTSQGAQSTDSIDWNTLKNFSQQFNVGTQKILFGKEEVVFANLTKNGNFYEGAVSFSETTGVGAFKAKPIITASAVFSNTTMPTNNAGINISVFNPTETGFGYRLTNTLHSSGTLGGRIYVNWIAIGPQ
jgi:hypothetical protein